MFTSSYKPFIILMAVFCTLSFSFSSAIGEDRAKEKSDLPVIETVKIDGKGIVDRIGSGEIVINDTWFKLSPNYTVDTGPNKKSLRVKTEVAYELNAKEEIIRIWVMD